MSFSRKGNKTKKKEEGAEDKQDHERAFQVLMDPEKGGLVQDTNGVITGCSLRYCILHFCKNEEESVFFHTGHDLFTTVDELFVIFLSIFTKIGKFEDKMKTSIARRITKFISDYLEVNQHKFVQGSKEHEILVHFIDELMNFGEDFNIESSWLLHKLKKISQYHIDPPIEPKLSPRVQMKSLLDYSVCDLVEQMCLIDQDLVKQIPLNMFLKTRWKQSIHITKFTEHYNKISDWTSYEVASTANPKKRQKVFSHFVSIAKLLLECQNLHGMLAIVSGLMRYPVERLEKTKGGLGASFLKKYEKLLNISKPTNNFSILRAIIKDAKPPFVYPLVLIMKDILVIEENIDSWLDTDKNHHQIMNLHKMRLIGKALQTILKSHEVSYNFTPDKEIQQFLLNVQVVPQEQLKILSKKNIKDI
uniref:Ras-GEF domain-containing protein n=1 Tax=Arcella intermedia TaxID=1963864 RepID=A0A6B2L587_9EUKA